MRKEKAYSILDIKNETTFDNIKKDIKDIIPANKVFLEEPLENFKRQIIALIDTLPTKKYIENYNKKSKRFFKKEQKKKRDNVLTALIEDGKPLKFNDKAYKILESSKNHKSIKKSTKDNNEFLNKYEIKRNKFINALDLFGITKFYQIPRENEMVVSYEGFESCGRKDGIYFETFEDTSAEPVSHPNIKNTFIIQNYYLYFAVTIDLYKELLSNKELLREDTADWFDYQAKNLIKRLLLEDRIG